MIRQQILSLGIAILLVTVFLGGCVVPAITPVSEAPVATPTLESPTSTPKPPSDTPTPEPSTDTSASSGPKIGHWEGDLSVSFDIGEEGNIQNFSITVPIQAGDCTITADEVKIETDGTFIVSELINLTEEMKSFMSVGAALGLPTPVITETNSGEMIESYRVNGKFDDSTTLTFSYTLTTCGNQWNQESTLGEAPTWNAKWQEP